MYGKLAVASKWAQGFPRVSVPRWLLARFGEIAEYLPNRQDRTGPAGVQPLPWPFNREMDDVNTTPRDNTGNNSD